MINISKIDSLGLSKSMYKDGYFVHLDKSHYQESFNAMIKKNRLIYENMINDLYYLGKVLDKKFRYIYWSYNIFLAGLILTVFAFLLVFFFEYY